MKPHTIGETLIRPAYTAIVRTIFGAEAEEEIKMIPSSNDTMSRRISNLSIDIEKSVINKIIKSKLFSLQLDESTDIGGKAQLLAFTRFIKDDKILEEFLCCKEFEKTTTGKYVFDIINTF
ncbi:protein ZBED8-like [Centruroides sculpturatus]|uniref:protein ZBED8-like n=1 Tax=Centruroides sculpturatus TaxID=218467 RepID=UPI000C6EB436|nr:protein ZBED8-like [Centruroides sculpturatus]